MLTPILILLGVGLVLGELFEQFRLAAVAGEILGGFVLGPAVLNVVNPSTPGLSSISDVALFFIVLLIGIEMTTYSIIQAYRKAVPMSVASFIVPVLIMALILYFGFREGSSASIIVALSIGVPSISIISILVRDYGIIQKISGQIIISSVIISDILAFFVLSSLMDEAAFVPKIAAILVFIAAIFIADVFIRRHTEQIVRAFSRLHATEHGERVIFGIIILGGLLTGIFFQFIGFTYVLGAFFAGMIISEFVVGRDILGILTRTLTRMNDGFFIPVYFTIAGLNVILPSPYSFLVLAVLLLVTGGVGALLTKLSAEKLHIGLKSMSTVGFLGGRGAVGVIIATTALSASLIDHDLYSLILLGTVILALFFPLLIGGEPEEELLETMTGV